MKIIETLRIICSKPRSSVRRHERLKELMVRKVEFEYGSLKFWREKAFYKLLRNFARNGNLREFNDIKKLSENSKFLTISNEDDTSKNLLEQSPIVSTKNGFFLYFDNFKDEEEKKVHGVEEKKVDARRDEEEKKVHGVGEKKVDARVDMKKFHCVEQMKDIETLRDMLGVPAENIVHHDQKRRNEILEEIAHKSNPDTLSSLSILVIVFIGHGKACKFF